jgi:hypothetical protein
MCQLDKTHSVDLLTRSLDKSVDPRLSWDALGDLRQPTVTEGIRIFLLPMFQGALIEKRKYLV